MYRTLKLAFLMLLTACGPKSSTSSSLPQAASEWGDTAPMKTQCFALARAPRTAVPVDYDDQAPVRLCAHLQADGHVALDLRYRPSTRQPVQQAATITLRNAQGQAARAMFPLHFQSLTQSFELYLSDGCILGSLEGCAEPSPSEMRELFAPLVSEEGALTFPAFTVEVAFSEYPAKKTPQGDLAHLAPYRVVMPAL